MDGVGDVAASFHAVVPALRAADCGVDSADLDRLRRQSVLRRALPGVDVVHGSVPTWHQRLAVVAAADDPDNAVVFCVIDNLCRGAASQAIANLNLVMGWPVDTGLRAPGPAV